MPKEVYSTWLDAFSRMTVEFIRERKDVMSFVVKLEVLRNSTWREVQRYDTHHYFLSIRMFSPVMAGSKGQSAMSTMKRLAD